MTITRDPVVEAMSEALARVLTARGGNWVAEPQWASDRRDDAGAATTSPQTTTTEDNE